MKIFLSVPQKNKCIQVWRDMRVSKIFFSSVNCCFNGIKQCVVSLHKWTLKPESIALLSFQHATQNLAHERGATHPQHVCACLYLRQLHVQTSLWWNDPFRSMTSKLLLLVQNPGPYKCKIILTVPFPYRLHFIHWFTFEIKKGKSSVSDIYFCFYRQDNSGGCVCTGSHWSEKINLQLSPAVISPIPVCALLAGKAVASTWISQAGISWRTGK